MHCRWLALALGCALGLVTLTVAAEDVDVPVKLQAALTAKVASYDRTLADSSKGRVVALVLVKSDTGDSVHVASQLVAELRRLGSIANVPLQVETLSFTSPAAVGKEVRARSASLLYLAPGFRKEAKAIASALDGLHVLSVASLASYVDEGIVLGFELRGGKPGLVVHLGHAKRQNVNFRPQLLALARVLR